MARNRACHGGRAVDAGQDADVIARRDAAIGAYDALEGRLWRRPFDRFDVGAERVIALELAHREVVDVHVLAGRDVARGETDDLVVTPHRLALLQRAYCDLVSGRGMRRPLPPAFVPHPR